MCPTPAGGFLHPLLKVGSQATATALTNTIAAAVVALRKSHWCQVVPDNTRILDPGGGTRCSRAKKSYVAVVLVVLIGCCYCSSDRVQHVGRTRHSRFRSEQQSSCLCAIKAGPADWESGVGTGALTVPEDLHAIGILGDANQLIR